MLLHVVAAALLVAVANFGMVRSIEPPSFVVAELIAVAPVAPAAPAVPTPLSSPQPASLEPVTAPAAPRLPASAPERTVDVLPLPAAESRHKPAATPPAPVATLPSGEPAEPTRAEEVDAIEPAPASSLAGDTQQVPDAQRLWEGRVLAHLERHKRYPVFAQQRGQEDRVLIRIRVDRAGQVLGQRVVDSKGVALLDREAEDLVQRANPLPPPPDEVQDQQLEFLVAIEFSIDQRNAALW